MAGLITGEDCRRKAAQWLDRTQAASDPKTSSSMRRACDAWTALAQQVERLSLRLPRSSAPAGRPARLVKSRNNIDSFHVGDMLRERLRLGDEPPTNELAFVRDRLNLRKVRRGVGQILHFYSLNGFTIFRR
jgi:hypothetical protein